MHNNSKNIDQALAEISHHLVSSYNADLKQILGILGTALGASAVYLVQLPYDDTVLLKYTEDQIDKMITLWHSNGEHAESEWLQTRISENAPVLPLLTHEPLDENQDRRDFPGFAIPILSAEDKLFGYLGMEHFADPYLITREEQESLSVLADLFVSYFTRKLAEHSLRKSEARWQNLVEIQPQAILITDASGIIYANSSSNKLLAVDSDYSLIGRSVQDFLPFNIYAQIETAQHTLNVGEASPILEHIITRTDGQERIVESILMPITYSGQPATYLALYDITERKEREEGYRTFVETISEAVWRLDLAQPLAITMEIKAQAEHLATHGFLAECNSVMARLLGADDPAAVTGHTLSPLLSVVDVPLLKEFLQNGYQLQNKEFSIVAQNPHPSHYVINAVGMVDRGYLKRIWGSCIEITERVELERRTVAMMEDQQERIGRDLHDSVGQLLTGIRILSTNLAMRYFEEGGPGFELAQKVVRFTEDASHAIRDIYRGLAPPQLYQEGLSISLESLASTIDVLPEVSCSFLRDDHVEILDRETKIQLYRIAQEATNNALKHARAKNIEISLKEHGQKIVLQIKDDGVGFDTNSLQSKSMGLFSMEHRANSIRAELVVRSTHGTGTTITCSFDPPKMLSDHLPES